MRALGARDPDLARVVRRLGDPPFWGRRPGFSTLIRIILEQQVSLLSARALYRRLDARVNGTTPEAVHALRVAGLRQLGFTRQKASYCHGLATRVLDGSLDLRAVARSPDADGRVALLTVPGLGPWSVDIYYLMALRRPDVWPQGDLALAASLRDVKGLRALPSRRDQETLAECWRPWRSVAARILWLHYLAERGQLAATGSDSKPAAAETHRADGGRRDPLLRSRTGSGRQDHGGHGTDGGLDRF